MKKNFILPAALFICIISIAIFSCSKSGSPYTYSGPSGPPAPTGFATDSISMTGTMFSPKVDTVHVGHAVKWQNHDGFTHTATSDDAGVTFNTGNIASGASGTFTPTSTGTITYHCIYHQSMGMVGTLIVKP
jgi:plastocyanin